MPCLAVEGNGVGDSLLALKDCAPVVAVLDDSSWTPLIFSAMDRKWGSENRWQLLGANVTPSTGN